MKTEPNPDNLTHEEILSFVTFCPICGTKWPRNQYICANRECGVKVRIEPKAYNWFLFYPKHNGWAYLERRLPIKREKMFTLQRED
ncbi:MAG: hypothetical protein BAJATHORv1_110048 [Candidatus Thorarchaeota archaeon]|nr:MAG: hypothetical protein BAJATHORv1_110048 [Candidatus Thorarchaeota archaeon]